MFITVARRWHTETYKHLSLTAKQTKHRCHFPPPHACFPWPSKTHWSQMRVAFSVLHLIQKPGAAPLA